MARLGADPGALEDLGVGLRRASGELRTIAGGLDRRVRSARWTGPDARRFQLRWDTEHLPALRAAAAGTSKLGTELRRQAAEQRDASGASAPTTPPSRTTGLLTVPSTSTTGLLEPLPRSEVRYLGGLEGEVGVVSISLAGTVTVQALGDDRARVVLSERVAGGATAGVGASAHAAIGRSSGSHPTVVGAQADVTGRVGALTRTTWDVPAERVDDLLVRVAADRGLRAATGTPDAVSRAASVLDRGVALVTGQQTPIGELVSLATAPPPPDRVEHLAEVSVSGAAGAGAVGATARASSAATVRAGVSGGTDGTNRSLVVEMGGSTTSTVAATLADRVGARLPAGASAITDGRLQVPLDDPAAPVVLHLSGGDGSTTTDVRVAFTEPGDGPAAGASARAARAFASGDVTTAVAHLGTVRPEQVQVSVTTGRVEAAGASAAGSVSLGARLGVGADGRVVEVRR